MPEQFSGMAYPGTGDLPVTPRQPHGVAWAPRPSPQQLIDTPDPSDTIARLLKIRPPATSYVPPAQPAYYPTPADVEFARKYDMTYGRPAAGIDTEGQRMGVLPSLDDVIRAYVQREWQTSRRPMRQEDRDREYAAWLASNRSPVAALGFDTGTMHTTPDADPNAYLATKSGDKLGAFYSPANDKMWYGVRDPQTIPHEATHRGIDILRKRGEPTVPRVVNEAEELMVRALMQKHFGGLEQQAGEHEQIQGGKIINYYYPRPVIEAEQAAQREIQRRHPMGPN